MTRKIGKMRSKGRPRPVSEGGDGAGEEKLVQQPPNVKWTKIIDSVSSNSSHPRPRHGHRAIEYENKMIVFGGGNEGMMDELYVFDTATQEWSQPAMKGDIPPGRAAYGLVVDGYRMLMHGGMVEHGRYSDELYELNLKKWEWKKLKPEGPRGCEPPSARLGHSFTIIRDKVYLFGGLTNLSVDLNLNIPRHMNDLYVLQARLNNEHGIWDVLLTFGNPPGPRESHSAVAHVSKDNRFTKLIIFGGMSGCRLGDLYMLDVDTLMWIKPEVKGAPPSPRSLHTATLVGDKMYVFGGWVPMMAEELKTSGKPWKCTNSLACLNVEALQWENIHHDILDDKFPRARAGHSAVVINTQIYVWSGRDGSRDTSNREVCFEDFWKLEVRKPEPPNKVQLLRAGTTWLDVGWDPVPGADSYLLQCITYDVPSDPIFQGDSNSNSSPEQQPSGMTGSVMTPASKSSITAVPPPVKVDAPSPALPLAPPPVVTASPTSITMEIPSQATILSTPVPNVPVSVSPASNLAPQQISLELPTSSLHPSAVGDNTLSSSGIALSMPSLAPTTASQDSAMIFPPHQQMTSTTISNSPAVSTTGSSICTLPATVAGTAGSLVSKREIRQVMAPVSSPQQQSTGQGVLRLRAPVQVSSPARPPTIVTSLPSGAVLATSSNASSAVETGSAQFSAMHAPAAAAPNSQKVQTPTAPPPPPTQTVKIVRQTPGLPQVFSPVTVSNVGGVLPPRVRLSSPVSPPSDLKQIIVKNPDGGTKIYRVVKTSQWMQPFSNIQGSKVIQGKPGSSGVTATSIDPASSIQGSPQTSTNNIIYLTPPGGRLCPAVSEPNIISNQPIINLSTQGTPGSPQRPTYIISKPAATTMPNRALTPQYVVATQAPAIRSIQGMTANSIAGGQTITLPTSVFAGGGSPHGVKMITVPKTVTLGSPKPVQYIRTGGRIVTIPPGFLQAGGQQQINIGGKQVTVQMAGGQTTPTLSNSGGQLIQTSQSPGDGGRPRFVMVGTAGQKPTIPTSSPLICTVPMGSGQLDSSGDAVTAETPMEMAGGSGPTADAQQLMSGNEQSNGIDLDGDQSGLKGGGYMFGPWSSFDFSSPSWMKLKGGGIDHDYTDKPVVLGLPKDSTIPIYSASSKFSWKMAFSVGLKGGNPENENNGDFHLEPLGSQGENTTEKTESSTNIPQDPIISSTSPNPSNGVPANPEVETEPEPMDASLDLDISPSDFEFLDLGSPVTVEVDDLMNFDLDELLNLQIDGVDFLNLEGDFVQMEVDLEPGQSGSTMSPVAGTAPKIESPVFTTSNSTAGQNVSSSVRPPSTTTSTSTQQPRLPTPGMRPRKRVSKRIPPPPIVVQSPHTTATNGTTRLPAPNTPAALPPPPEEKVENWMDVVHTKNTSHVARCYFTTNEKLSTLEPDVSVEEDVELMKKRIELKPATVYKFRVAAINSCGRGPWGEVSTFKTCLPGFPTPPSCIKISKSVNGAGITWEPPVSTSGDILEYSVYMAVNPPADAPEPKPGMSTMCFVLVYCGPSNQCNVPTALLGQALVDTTSEPGAIIFRIAAKNAKGYGPATQVRWLQESPRSGISSKKSGARKRSSAGVSKKRGRTAD